MSVAFAVVGTLTGLLYAMLGLVAIRHQVDPPPSEVDRVAGWTLWWFAAKSNYSDYGQRLCGRGLFLFAASLISWLLWFAAK